MKYIITESQHQNIIHDYLEKYFDSDCVKVKKTRNYIIVDVESPSYFEEQGFDKSDVVRIKNFLKKNSFQYGFGEYIKKI
jgi:uncharacterized FlgJ-related protein